MACDGGAGSGGESTGWRRVGHFRAWSMRAGSRIGIALHALHHPWLNPRVPHHRWQSTKRPCAFARRSFRAASASDRYKDPALALGARISGVAPRTVI